MRRGADFHRLVQQQLLGIPEERLAASIEDPALARLWQHYLDFRPIEQAAGSHVYQAFSEVTLMTALAGYQLMAKYDVIIALENGDIIIFDWKTSKHRYAADQAKERLQTRVYRSVAVCSGAQLIGVDTVTPDRVTMVYWFAAHPTAPVRLPYSETAYERDLDELHALASTIRAAAEADTEGDAFPKTENAFLCRYCPFRSYCGRGVRAGDIDERELAMELEEMGAESSFELDFDQIAEIEF
jgi:hypothetical protein